MLLPSLRPLLLMELSRARWTATAQAVPVLDDPCECPVQVRPGRVLTLVLATAGLTGVGLGSTACLTLLLTWLFVGTAPPAASPGLKGRELGDDVLSSEELDSNAELDSGGRNALCMLDQW